MIGRLRHSSIWTAIFWLSSLTVLGLTRVPQRAWVMSSTRRTETPARYISTSASSTLISRRLYRSMIARLEGQLAQLRHLQRHLAGLGVELALVMAGPGVDPLRRMLVALRPAELVRFGVQHGVQRLFHGRYDDFVEVVLDQAFVDGDHVTKGLRCAVRGWRRSVGGSAFVHGSETFLRTTRSKNVRKNPDVI